VRDNDPVLALTRPPVEHPRVYADGSALTRYLEGAPDGEAWREWVAHHEAELVTTPLGISELRGTARPLGPAASGVAHEVAERVDVVRFSDQSVRRATQVSGVLPPFVALHVGAALAHPDVTTVATYDVHLARVSALYGLRVISPGRPPSWWRHDPTPWE
jgi:predicted nucleic acid-binding protein